MPLGHGAGYAKTTCAADWRRRGGSICSLTTGGVSVGDYDLVKQVLQREGRIDLWQVRHQTGQAARLRLARGRRRCSGCRATRSPRRSPSSSSRGRPSAGCSAIAASRSRPCMARLAGRVENRGGRRHFVRVARRADGPGGYVARVAGGQGVRGAEHAGARRTGCWSSRRTLAVAEDGACSSRCRCSTGILADRSSCYAINNGLTPVHHTLIDIHRGDASPASATGSPIATRGRNGWSDGRRRLLALVTISVLLVAAGHGRSPPRRRRPLPRQRSPPTSPRPISPPPAARSSIDGSSTVWPITGRGPAERFAEIAGGRRDRGRNSPAPAAGSAASAPGRSTSQNASRPIIGGGARRPARQNGVRYDVVHDRLRRHHRRRQPGQRLRRTA